MSRHVITNTLLLFLVSVFSLLVLFWSCSISNIRKCLFVGSKMEENVQHRESKHTQGLSKCAADRSKDAFTVKWNICGVGVYSLTCLLSNLSGLKQEKVDFVCLSF